MAADPVESVAADAEDARTRIASTIDEIQDRLDPRRIVGNAMDRVSGSSRQFVGQAKTAARSHPLAIAAAVAAIGVALLARGKLARATVNLGDGEGEYTDYDDGFGYDAGRAPRAYGDEDGDDDVAPPVRRQALAASASGSVADNPVVSILMGLAAGAALGALFPTTEAERRALGDTGAKLGAAARAAARRASDELDAHGLSVDTVRARASEATRKAKQAAQSVMDAARDEMKG
ncbi:DUF3618 domain-containing protein [Sandarakinorhabdus sp. DWP1-3-1]|uniref:DUF3618 domain-containing protein n=1 Tax=Sandarakinorhabdus sp. DWP1-3-1 TaxID=2804627 RepID=UPI003CEE775B